MEPYEATALAQQVEVAARTLVDALNAQSIAAIWQFASNEKRRALADALCDAMVKYVGSAGSWHFDALAPVVTEVLADPASRERLREATLARAAKIIGSATSYESRDVFETISAAAHTVGREYALEAMQRQREQIAARVETELAAHILDASVKAAAEQLVRELRTRAEKPAG